MAGPADALSQFTKTLQHSKTPSFHAKKAPLAVWFLAIGWILSIIPSISKKEG
tara:strand:- start:282 stop:440 length:159 start_codon:yes stop_codon:yes gene_type:complete